MKSISNQLCMRILEMLDGNKKKVMANKTDFNLSEYIFTFSKIHLAPKISSCNWKLTQYKNEVYL